MKLRTSILTKKCNLISSSLPSSSSSSVVGDGDGAVLHDMMVRLLRPSGAGAVNIQAEMVLLLLLLLLLMPGPSGAGGVVILQTHNNMMVRLLMPGPSGAGGVVILQTHNNMMVRLLMPGPSGAGGVAINIQTEMVLLLMLLLKAGQIHPDTKSSSGVPPLYDLNKTFTKVSDQVSDGVAHGCLVESFHGLLLLKVAMNLTPSGIVR